MIGFLRAVGDVAMAGLAYFGAEKVLNHVLSVSTVADYVKCSSLSNCMQFQLLASHACTYSVIRSIGFAVPLKTLINKIDQMAQRHLGTPPIHPNFKAIAAAMVMLFLNIDANFRSRDVYCGIIADKMKATCQESFGRAECNLECRSIQGIDIDLGMQICTKFIELAMIMFVYRVTLYGNFRNLFIHPAPQVPANPAIQNPDQWHPKLIPRHGQRILLNRRLRPHSTPHRNRT